ncbi:MAG TPA: class I adenylate-forming enzyme family protein, partial [Stellaceae bacterium]|nr:class I adenylate-forming enzyme family protein [Stellaceae bacterium]
MTADYIAYHAAERPDAVALLDRGREISYAQLHRDLSGVVRAVTDFGFARGSSAAIAWGEFYPHCLLLLACERLGIATATFVANEGEAGAGLLESVDVVLSETRPPGISAERHRALTQGWLADALARGDAPIPAAATQSPQDPFRILRTSGTTGVPKRLLVRRHMFEAHIQRWSWVLGIARTSKCIVNTPFSANGSFTLSMAVLRAGGSVLFPGLEIGTAAALAGPARAATHLRIAPLELKRVLDELPPGFEKPAALTVCTVGGPLPAVLREQALARLANEVIVSYACNEMPFIAVIRDAGSEGVGTVVPWAEAEVVDELDRLVPLDTPGRLRVRDAAMAEGYLDDPVTTAQKFRNGWFYPGDIAISRGPRRLQVVGRDDEILNVGGLKIAASALEAWVLRHATVGDIGICALAGDGGVNEICVAVADPAHDDAELLARITEAFRHNH